MPVQSTAIRPSVYEERVRISDRVTRLREDFLAAAPYVCGERSHLFTQ